MCFLGCSMVSSSSDLDRGGVTLFRFDACVMRTQTFDRDASATLPLGPQPLFGSHLLDSPYDLNDEEHAFLNLRA